MSRRHDEYRASFYCIKIQRILVLQFGFCNFGGFLWPYALARDKLYNGIIRTISEYESHKIWWHIDGKCQEHNRG